ncbi:MAG TPA: YceI family protein [Rhodanobacteraceae bacterium]|nr:YceI family protein [Rhodanobacteraceae bacterium]
MKRALPLALILMVLPLAALAHSWTVDATQSTLGFDGSFQGGAFHGVFKRFDSDIRYEPADLADARFDVTIDLASVDTQASERDETLRGADFFDVAHTPKAHFVTRAFHRAADGSVTAEGTLELHGHSQPVTLAVQFKPTAGGATLDVSTTLDRLDFGLGTSSDWADISKRIGVRGHLVLK